MNQRDKVSDNDRRRLEEAKIIAIAKIEIQRIDLDLPVAGGDEVDVEILERIVALDDAFDFLTIADVDDRLGKIVALAQLSHFIVANLKIRFVECVVNRTYVREADPAELSNDTAMPLALILNELLTNAVKHAIPAGAPGTIRAGLSRQADSFVLSVEDDGPGFGHGGALSGAQVGFGLIERALALGGLRREVLMLQDGEKLAGFHAVAAVRIELRDRRRDLGHDVLLV